MGARKVAGLEFALLRGEAPLFASVLVLPLASFVLYAAFQAVLLSQEDAQVSAAFRGFVPVAVYSEGLFSWGRLGGADAPRLRSFLADGLGLGWAEGAEVRDLGGGAVRASAGREWAEVRLGADRRGATVVTSGGRVVPLIASEEDGELVLRDGRNLVLAALENVTTFELVSARSVDEALALVDERRACMAVVMKGLYIDVNHTATLLVYRDRSNPKADLALRDLMSIVRAISDPVVRENLQFASEVEAPIVVEATVPDEYASARDRPLGAAAGGGGGGGPGGAAAGAEEAGRAVEQSIPLAVLFVSCAFLAGAFLIGGMCAMSIANERVRRRGELLLSAPLDPSDVLAGKVAPYACLVAYLAIAVAGYLRWEGLVPQLHLSLAVLGVVGALPLAVACLVGAVAVSFHQLTFLLTFSYFLLFLVFVVPALLVKLTLASFVSPLTVLILLALKAPLEPARLALSLAPSLVVAAAAAAATRVLFTTERLLYESPSLAAVALDLADAALVRLPGPLGELVAFPALVSVTLFPLVFIAELATLFVVFSVLPAVSMLGVLLTVPVWALAEELAKSAGLFLLAFRRPGLGHLFGWDRLPGADDDRLRAYLREDLRLDWAGSATVQRTGGGEAVRASSGAAWAELRLSGDRKDVHLETSDGRVRRLLAREEGAELNVYSPGSAASFALAGAASGLGFFAAEKALNLGLLSAAVPLDAWLLGLVLVSTGLSALVQAGCSAIYGVGVHELVREGRPGRFAALFLLAVAVHLAVDLVIISGSMGAMGW